MKNKANRFIGGFYDLRLRVITSAILVCLAQSCFLGAEVQKDTDAVAAENLVISHHKESIFKIKFSAIAEKKQFLVQRLTFEQRIAPEFSSDANWITWFKIRGKKLLLLEADTGAWIPTHSRPEVVICSFEITEQSNDYVFFDFISSKMKSYSPDLWTSDFATGIDIRQAYSKNTENHFEDHFVSKKNHRIVIDFLSHAESPSIFSGKAYRPIKTRFTIGEYKENKDFVEKRSSVFRDVGFFETKPKFEAGTGEYYTNILRFDIGKDAEKKIPYFYTENTPLDVRSAIEDGVLYWNKTFGREILTCEVLPSDVKHLDPDYNIISWIENDNASFAYANWSYDPKTGEITSARVYLNSFWYMFGKLFIQKQHRALSSETYKQHRHEQFACDCLDSIQGPFQKQTLANFFVDSKLFDLKPENIEKLALEKLRLVVAHEVGHTLGLRHNFAAHLVNDLSPYQLQESLQRHFKDPDAIDEDILSKEVVNSVMHYTRNEVDSLIGHQLRHRSTALSYDQKAIAWGYFSSWKEGEQTEECPFATDSHMTKYDDVGQFRTFANPFTESLFEQQRFIEGLPQVVIEQYIAAKVSVAQGFQQSLKTSKALDPSLFAQSLADLQKENIYRLGGSARSLLFAIRNGFEPIEDNRENFFEFEKKNIQEAGGANNILFRSAPFGNVISQIFPEEHLSHVKIKTQEKEEQDLEVNQPPIFSPLAKDWINLLEEQFENKLNSEHVQKFTWPDGKKYEFTPEEITFIRARGKSFLKQFIKSYRTAYLEVLASLRLNTENDLEDHRVLYFSSLQESFAALAQDIIFASSGERITASLKTPDGKPTLSLEKPLYEQKQRVLAAQLLCSDIGGSNYGWNNQARSDFGRKMISYISDSLGVKVSYVIQNESALSPELRSWVANNLELLNLLQLNLSEQN